MKNILKISGIFFGGVIVGAILMNLLDMYVRPTYRNMIRTEIKTDQQFLASRATREGNKLEAAMHRWFVLEMDSEKSRHKQSDKEIDSSFLFPFYMTPLRIMENSNRNRTKNGWYIVEGMDRAYLAAALESIDENAEASNQWHKAQALLRRSSVEDTRKLILHLLEQEKTDTYIQAEKKILGDTNQAQQKNRGDKD